MFDIKPPALRHLFTLEAALAPSLDAGEGPLGRRVLNAVSEGRFYGERLNGRINPGTGDWMLTRNGIRVVDARVVLLCDDNAIIHMSYGGRIWFDDAVLPALGQSSNTPPNRSVAILFPYKLPSSRPAIKNIYG